MGDMFPWRDAPFLDRSNGGSGVSFPETLQALIDNVDGYDTVVPGHIPVTTPESLQEYQRFTADLLAAVRGAIEAGQSAEEARRVHRPDRAVRGLPDRADGGGHRGDLRGTRPVARAETRRCRPAGGFPGRSAPLLRSVGHVVGCERA